MDSRLHVSFLQCFHMALMLNLRLDCAIGNFIVEVLVSILTRAGLFSVPFGTFASWYILTVAPPEPFIQSFL